MSEEPLPPKKIGSKAFFHRILSMYHYLLLGPKILTFRRACYIVYFKSMRSALELTYYVDFSVTLCVFVRSHSLLQGRRNLGTNGFMNPPKFGPEKHHTRASFDM